VRGLSLGDPSNWGFPKSAPHSGERRSRSLFDEQRQFRFAAAGLDSEIRAEVAASALNERSELKAMPQRTFRLTRLATRLALLWLASVALVVLRRSPSSRRRRPGARRIAVSLSFATLFFAGASFSAGAGDLMVGLVEEQAAKAVQEAEEAADPECTAPRRSDWDAEETAEQCPDEEPAENPAEAPIEPPPAQDGTQDAAPATEPVTESPTAAELVEQTAAAEAAASETELAPAPSLSDAVRGQARKTSPAPRPPAPPKHDPAPPVIEPQSHTHEHATHPDPEIEAPNTAATVWLHRALPDPTPPSKRLTRPFARNLSAASRRHRVDWALVLGVLRARGERGSAPAGKARLDRLARSLARLDARKHPWSAVLALEGRTAFADRTIALARYHRAVGLKALVRGLEWAGPRLTQRLLADEKVTIYPAGRADLIAGRIDVRVIVLIRYLRIAHGQVTVSSLKSGHRFFSRPGVVSAHSYGQAVDIAALGGQSIMGHQLPGSITEQAVRNVLLLPAEVRPVQVISLLGLGGPSFPMANHDDHIHAGF
jgi:hypothetical protein